MFRWTFYELRKFGHLNKDMIKHLFEVQGGGFIIGFVLGALVLNWALLFCLLLGLLTVVSLINGAKK